jgi:hypothetical protein
MAKIYLKDLGITKEQELRFPADYLPEDWKLIEEGEWADEGKYSYARDIYRYQGKFYAHYKSRSGSYFSDYEYNNEDYLEEVEPTEKIIRDWKVVED